MIAAKYAVERVLGQGGMGVVVAARHLGLDERVALKLLPASDEPPAERARRLRREARAAARLRSKHAVRVVDIGQLDDGSPFLLMEYIEGRSLADVVRRDGPLPVEQAVDCILQACDAVAEARFGLAELVYQRFLRTRAPTFRGASTASAFDAWTRGQLRPYIQVQQARLRDEATPMFESVMRSGVPHWQIAAGARLADMYIRFANIIRETPFPPDWNHPGEPYDTLRDQWRLRLDEETQPLVDLAKTGYQQCLQRATRARWFNEWSQLCERNLNEIDRQRYPLTEEIRTQPNLLFSRASNARVVFTMQAEDDSGEGGAPETTPPASGAAPNAQAGGR